MLPRSCGDGRRSICTGGKKSVSPAGSLEPTYGMWPDGLKHVVLGAGLKTIMETARWPKSLQQVEFERVFSRATAGGVV